MVQKNIYKCITCTTWMRAYCKGMHECLYQLNTDSYTSKWSMQGGTRYISPESANSYLQGDLSYLKKVEMDSISSSYQKKFRTGMSNGMAVEAAISALANEINILRGGDSRIYESVQVCQSCL